MIYAAFERLEAGQSMMLINDHDPKPLYHEFSAEKPGMFNWDYVEKGPEIWKVVITKSRFEHQKPKTTESE